MELYRRIALNGRTFISPPLNFEIKVSAIPISNASLRLSSVMGLNGNTAMFLIVSPPDLVFSRQE
jgi:hypothetical protein